MSVFGRTIPDEAMIVARRLVSEKTGWFPDLLRNWAPSGSIGQLRIAIRNGYVNFYAKGQSVAKITFNRRNRCLALNIHSKYATPSNNSGQKYVRFDMSGDSNLASEVRYYGSQTLDFWIGNALKYTTGEIRRSNEKRHIDNLIETHSTVIDLEMGLPVYENRKNSLRVDIVSLEEVDGEIRIVFSEAKMISDSRLRSRNHKPEVLEQIERYRAYLDNSERQHRIVKAYTRACRIIRDFHVMASELTEMPPLDELILAAAKPDSRLRVDKTLRLIVFDDKEKKREDAWQEHLGVLKRHKVRVTVLR